MSRGKKSKPLEEEFAGDKASIEWLKAQKESTQRIYRSLWKHFLEFTNLTGDQILASRKEDKENLWEKRVIEFKERMSKEIAESSAKTASACVRGFFSFYRLDLKFRRAESAKLREAQRKYEDYRFILEDLKKMFDVADLIERYVLTLGKSFAMRAGDFLALTRGDLEPYLGRPVPISIGEYVTQKEKVKAYPFIDTDALPVVKLMIEKMDRDGRTDPKEKILTYSHDIQLSRVLQRLADRAGVKYGTKNVRFHCLRKFLIDHLTDFMASEKWKQIVGKKISESAYVSPDTLRDDYMRAMAETTFTKPVSDNEAELRMAERMLKAIGLFDKYELKVRQKKDITIPEKLKIADKMLEENGKAQTQTNGGDCGETFEQIPEANLLAYLKQGWRIECRLASGEIIIKR